MDLLLHSGYASHACAVAFTTGVLLLLLQALCAADMASTLPDHVQSVAPKRIAVPQSWMCVRRVLVAARHAVESAPRKSCVIKQAQFFRQHMQGTVEHQAGRGG